MKRFFTKAAQTGVSVVDAVFKTNSYAALTAIWERHVFRKARVKAPLRNDGVNLFFCTSTHNSHAKTGRDLAFKLSKAGIPVSVVDTTPPWSNPVRIQGAEFQRIKQLECRTAPFRKTIVFAPANKRPIRGYSMSFVLFWEFNDFPGSRRYQYFNEAFSGCCFSDFCRDIVKNSSTRQDYHISKIRYPFLFPPEERGLGRAAIRRKIDIPDEAFAVFFNFSFSAVQGRKNPKAVIDAFSKAFGKDEKAWLIVKTSDADGYAAKAEEFYSYVRTSDIGNRVRVVGNTLEMGEILDLTAAMDVYLSLHRSEGLGLGILEAMSLGVPVVATGHGGNMEFMREDNSFIVPFEYKTWTPSCGFPRQVADWGEPNVDEAARLLRQVRENPLVAKEKARNGIAFVRDFYSLENFKNDMISFLDS